MTHRDGFPRLSARSAWRGDAGHRKPCAPSKSIGPSASLDDPSSAAAALPLRRVDAPHRPRLPRYPPGGPPGGPTDRLPDLYGSLSTLLGISGDGPSMRCGSGSQGRATGLAEWRPLAA